MTKEQLQAFAEAVIRAVYSAIGTGDADKCQFG